MPILPLLRTTKYGAGEGQVTSQFTTLEGEDTNSDAQPPTVAGTGLADDIESVEQHIAYSSAEGEQLKPQPTVTAADAPLTPGQRTEKDDTPPYATTAQDAPAPDTTRPTPSTTSHADSEVFATPPPSPSPPPPPAVATTPAQATATTRRDTKTRASSSQVYQDYASDPFPRDEIIEALAGIEGHLASLEQELTVLRKQHSVLLSIFDKHARRK